MGCLILTSLGFEIFKNMLLVLCTDIKTPWSWKLNELKWKINKIKEWRTHKKNQRIT